MSSPAPPTVVGPFSVVDADTGERIQVSRATRLATAFSRLDRYLASKPKEADALVVSRDGIPVPRPRGALPSRIIDGRTPTERRQRHIWRAVYELQN